MAAALSVVLRHEQGLVFVPDAAWCSGHACPSP